VHEIQVATSVPQVRRGSSVGSTTGVGGAAPESAAESVVSPGDEAASSASTTLSCEDALSPQLMMEMVVVMTTA
jgi:hypothetical protein